MNKINNHSWLHKTTNIVCWVVCILIMAGCNVDEEDSIKEDPYAGGREPLAVKLLSEAPSPESAGPKEKVTFRVSGLAKYTHEEDGTFDFDFYISDEICQIESATDSTLTIIVPDAVSSGTTYLVLENQIFYGPYFKVMGSVSIDEGFEYYKTGPYNGIIRSCVPWCGNTGLTSEFYLCGDFRQAQGKYYGGIAMVNNEKGLLKYGTADKIKITRGIEAGIYVDDDDNLLHAGLNGMEYWKKDTESPRALLYGLFKEYETYSTTLVGFKFKNVLLVNNDLTVKTEKKKFSDFNGKTHEISVPTFVGGTMFTEEITRAFSTADGKIVAVGNFTTHLFTDYDNTTCDANNKLVTADIYTSARSVMKMDEIGQLDKTYRRNPMDDDLSLLGAEGTINDACMLNDESVIIVGDIYKFDGKPIRNIVKLDKDGQIDEEFLSTIGEAANGEINQVTCTSFKDGSGELHERIVIVGNFTTFNGQSAQGLAILNSDGSMNSEFVLKELEGGIVNFAKIVDLNTNGEIAMPHVVISGTFTKYAGVTRQGFLILDMKGDAIQRFNVPGRFYGGLYDAQYSLTSDNTNGLLLTGDFRIFDGKRMNNIVMLKVDLEENTNNEP